MVDATIGNDVRRIHIFDTWNKLQIKAEVEEVKILDEVMMYEYGGVRNKSREEAIMIQDVMGERCARGKVNTTLKAFDGINAFNTMKKEHKEELFTNSVYHLAVKDQNMKHATFVKIQSL